METVKGQGLLKVTGILMIIFGIFAVIISVLGIAGGSLLMATGTEAGAVIGTLVIASLVVSLITGVLELVAGIMGVKKCKIAGGAKSCLIFGIILIVISLGSGIFSIAVNGGSYVFSAIIGLVLPVLYTLGAYQNVKG